MSKYARKRNKRGVAERATPDQVIELNPITPRYCSLSDAKSVLECRHHELGSWRILAYELGYNHGTLYSIAKRGRAPDAKLIKKLNSTYGSRVVYQNPIPVLPCSKCGQLHAFSRRCPGASTKYAPHPVMRLSRIRRILQSPYLTSS